MSVSNACDVIYRPVQSTISTLFYLEPFLHHFNLTTRTILVYLDIFEIASIIKYLIKSL